MNLLMFMALLFAGWNQSILRDLAASEVRVNQTAGPVSEADRSEENKKAAADLPNSSRSFAFSTPTREWLRTHCGDASLEHLLLPGSTSAPAYLPTLAFGTLGRTTLPVSAGVSLPHCGRAPPLTT